MFVKQILINAHEEVSTNPKMFMIFEVKVTARTADQLTL